jgi:hypothetical protein
VTSVPTVIVAGETRELATRQTLERLINELREPRL